MRTPGRPYTVFADTRFLTRDDCPTCNEGRDRIGRLPVGWCGDSCLMARIRRGEVAAYVVVNLEG